MSIHVLKKQGLSYDYIDNNHAALSFSKDAAKTVNKISQPIFSLGVQIFTYCKIFDNTKFLYLCSDGQWVEHYFVNNYQNDLEHFQHYVPLNIKHAFWSEFKMDKVFQAAYQEFNYWHGFSMYERSKNYVEYFDFGANRNNDEMQNVYLNKLPFFSQFIQYFKEEASNLINTSDDSKLISHKGVVAVDRFLRRETPNEKNKIEQSHSQENSSVNALNLTCNEKECLLRIYQGKTLKEIGQELSIPAKTAEFYIKSIKHKAEVLTKSELHDFLKNDRNFSLIFSYFSMTATNNSDTDDLSLEETSNFPKNMKSAIRYISVVITVILSVVAYFSDSITTMINMFGGTIHILCH